MLRRAEVVPLALLLMNSAGARALVSVLARAWRKHPHALQPGLSMLRAVSEPELLADRALISAEAAVDERQVLMLLLLMLVLI